MSGPDPVPPIVVLISGRGSNMQALIESSLDGTHPYRVALVLSDKPAAPGLHIARDLRIPARAVPHEGCLDRTQYDRTLAAAIDEAAPALIVLAGFMRMLSPEFVGCYRGRILNIHPSLLPKYPGLHAHRQALAAGDRVHGATVHFVTEQLDAGPAVIQSQVKVYPDDDTATLADRVRQQEHKIYPIAVRWFCSGRLRCIENRAWLDGSELFRPVSFDDAVARS